METSTVIPAPLVRHASEAPATWFLNGLKSTLATRDETGGAYCLMEHLISAAANPPMHIQTYEDEAFYVLEGVVEVETEGVVGVARPGTFAFVPRGAAHTFRVLSETARVLVIASGEAVNGGLDDFFDSVGVPAEARTLPVPAAPDIVALDAAATAHGIQLLPPA